MGRKCSVCAHSERDVIERAVLAGEGLREISGRFGISTSALHRHKTKDVPAALARAVDAEGVAHDANLLEQVKDLIRQAQGIFVQAEGQGDARTALAAIREVRGTIELLAKMTGQLNAPLPEFPRQPLFNLPPGARVAVRMEVSTTENHGDSIAASVVKELLASGA